MHQGDVLNSMACRNSQDHKDESNCNSSKLFDILPGCLYQAEIKSRNHRASVMIHQPTSATTISMLPAQIIEMRQCMFGCAKRSLLGHLSSSGLSICVHKFPTGPSLASLVANSTCAPYMCRPKHAFARFVIHRSPAVSVTAACIAVGRGECQVHLAPNRHSNASKQRLAVIGKPWYVSK